jgi:hypothetical protein
MILHRTSLTGLVAIRAIQHSLRKDAQGAPAEQVGVAALRIVRRGTCYVYGPAVFEKALDDLPMSLVGSDAGLSIGSADRLLQRGATQVRILSDKVSCRLACRGPRRYYGTCFGTWHAPHRCPSVGLILIKAKTACFLLRTPTSVPGSEWVECCMMHTGRWTCCVCSMLINTSHDCRIVRSSRTSHLTHCRKLMMHVAVYPHDYHTELPTFGQLARSLSSATPAPHQKRVPPFKLSFTCF